MSDELREKVAREDRMTIPAMYAQNSGEVVGYMCAVDWECELGGASGGNTVFPCFEDARKHLKCSESCGIVEVEVRYRGLALQGTSEVAPFEEPAPETEPAPMSVAEAARVLLEEHHRCSKIGMAKRTPAENAAAQMGRKRLEMIARTSRALAPPEAE